MSERVGQSPSLGPNGRKDMKKIFAVVLILAGYAIGQAAKPPQTAKTPKPSVGAVAPQGSHVGRYQLFFSPHARADVYLVDTETGKIWKPITIGNAKDTNLKSEPEVWVYQDRIDNEKEFDVWIAFHKLPPPAATPPQ
jgi:hypothetical protein